MKVRQVWIKNPILYLNSQDSLLLAFFPVRTELTAIILSRSEHPLEGAIDISHRRLSLKKIYLDCLCV